MKHLVRFHPSPRPWSSPALALWLMLSLTAGPLIAQTGEEGKLPDLKPLRVIDAGFIDTTANACTDFFQYANGAWLAHDTIPAAYASSGVGRDMADRNQLVVRSVLEDAMARRSLLPMGSTTRKLGTFYASCMDSTAAESAGLGPIKPWLAAIDLIDSPSRLVSEIAALQTRGANVGFRYRADVDPHDAGHYLASLYQGGLGLPDRDYYTSTGAEADSTRAAYRQHIGRMFILAGTGAEPAAAAARDVVALETELAGVALTRVERRDPAATDHPMSLAQLDSLAPHVGWPLYFRGIGLTAAIERVNVGEPRFIQHLDSLLNHAPLASWRAYLRYHALEATGPWLSTPLVQEDFAFGARFSGARELLPRWKRCLGEADGDLGEALGEAYVGKTFPPEARDRAKAVIDDIRTAFGARLRELSWMSDSTRTQALHKLARMGEKVGYPEHWRDYSRLEIVDRPFVLNVASANRFEWQRTGNRPGTPVDKTEWDITVPTVNAYYDGTKNEMVFPAGALVPQTFDPGADDGANYGSLGGSWAGHELTHGFDDEGRHYDADGNLRDWWTGADSAPTSSRRPRSWCSSSTSTSRSTPSTSMAASPSARTSPTSADS